MKLPIWLSKINSSLDICESPTWDSVQMFTNYILWVFSPTSRPGLANLFRSMSVMLSLYLVSKECILQRVMLLWFFLHHWSNKWFAGRPGYQFIPSMKLGREACYVSIYLLSVLCEKWKERVDLQGGSLRGQSLYPWNPSLGKIMDSGDGLKSQS